MLVGLHKLYGKSTDQFKINFSEDSRKSTRFITQSSLGEITPGYSKDQAEHQNWSARVQAR